MREKEKMERGADVPDGTLFHCAGQYPKPNNKGVISLQGQQFWR